MKATTKIIFDDDEYLYLQAAAFQSYLNTLKAHTAKLGAKFAVEFIFSTLANGIIDSGASTTSITYENK